ncbi:MAG TPA: class I SAM-dependent methyltransferase [Candidatus Limnocylindrales bacterium]|nr:class I SAM-dependent methyltransferase [Candidatus Limnocylindrales bacterium]
MREPRPAAPDGSAPEPSALPHDWDGASYDRVADPMTRWGTDVLERLPLRGDETVLDAGCGSGRVTEQLCERLPRGRVIALDASPSMIAAARERLARFGDRTVYLVANLAGPLPLAAGSVDAVLSTAALHWVRDHDALFGHLAVPLRPGGRLVAQCGGAGNIARVVEVLRTVGDGWPGPWTFATPEETRARLERSGFEAVETWLHDEPARFDDDTTFREYLRTVVLGAHLERLASDADRDAFVAEVAAGLPEREVAYVRLNILATRVG